MEKIKESCDGAGTAPIDERLQNKRAKLAMKKERKKMIFWTRAIFIIAAIACILIGVIIRNEELIALPACLLLLMSYFEDINNGAIVEHGNNTVRKIMIGIAVVIYCFISYATIYATLILPITVTIDIMASSLVVRGLIRLSNRKYVTRKKRCLVADIGQFAIAMTVPAFITIAIFLICRNQLPKWEIPLLLACALGGIVLTTGDILLSLLLKRLKVKTLSENSEDKLIEFLQEICGLNKQRSGFTEHFFSIKLWLFIALILY